MESIKELRVMLQTNVLGHPILQRVLSIYLTRPLLSTSVTPNQVTVFMLLLGAAASAAMFAGYFILAIVLIYLNLLFDAVDGEIARYKKMYSLRGIYLDLVNHLWTGSLFFFAVAFYASGLPAQANPWVLLVGMVGGLAQTVRRANGDLHRIMFVRQYRDLKARLGPILATAPEQPHQSAHPSHVLRRLVRRAAEAVYEVQELAPLAIILFVAYLAELFIVPAWPGHPLLSAVVVVYGLVSCLYLVREIFGGFFSLESRINALRAWFASL